MTLTLTYQVHPRPNSMVQLNSTMISHKSVYCVCSGPCLCIEESLVDQNRGTLTTPTLAGWVGLRGTPFRVKPFKPPNLLRWDSLEALHGLPRLRERSIAGSTFPVVCLPHSGIRVPVRVPRNPRDAKALDAGRTSLVMTSKPICEENKYDHLTGRDKQDPRRDDEHSHHKLNNALTTLKACTCGKAALLVRSTWLYWALQRG